MPCLPFQREVFNLHHLIPGFEMPASSIRGGQHGQEMSRGLPEKTRVWRNTAVRRDLFIPHIWELCASAKAHGQHSGGFPSSPSRLALLPGLVRGAPWGLPSLRHRKERGSCMASAPWREVSPTAAP